MRTLLLVLALSSAALVAQTTTVTTPDPASPQNVDRPFPGGIGRYQQWYSASSLTATLTNPMRIQQLEFFAGSSNSSNATTIDMEVSMGHGNSMGLSGTFASNYSSTPVVVLPRQNVQLLAGAAGAVVMTVPFATKFTWDHIHPIVVEIKIYGNSRGNQTFTYNLRGTTASIGVTARNYIAGNATAANGTAQAGVGLATRFTARPGVVLDFGAGCPGSGNFVPHNTSTNIPSAGGGWINTLDNASSQRLCALAIGTSNTQTSSVPPLPLPYDFGNLLGLGTTGCNLLVDPAVLLWTQTVGGGAGGGTALVSIQLPGMTWYIGLSLYTQWLVNDPGTANGVVAVSQGVWAIVAPVGG